jgi:beta-1,2-mannosidase
MKDLFKRSKHNPVISPDKRHDWESLKVFNPGAIYHDGKYHLFYRASGGGADWHSVLGYAVSEDGEHFQRFDQPLLDRESSNPLELRGLEDPRITKIGDTFYMAYAAYDGHVPRLFVATSSDLKRWHRHGPVLRNFNFAEMGGVSVKWKKGKASEVRANPSKHERSKAGGIFPERVNGKYYMLFNELRMWMATSDDGIHWDALPEVFLGPRKGTDLFDNVFVEMGPAPIKTDRGARALSWSKRCYSISAGSLAP